MDAQQSNIDLLIKARAEIDEKLRRHEGSVTILFTDVVGSTSYFDRYGDTAGLLVLHRCADLASHVVAEFQGTVIKTIGDSVMAEFPEPALATLLVMFRPIGSFEEWVAFAVWGLFVAAAAAIAFKSSLLAAYRRVALAFQ